MIKVERARKDIGSISYNLLKRQNFSVKFKCRFYTMGYNNDMQYYHSEYIYNTNNGIMSTISLTPTSMIVIESNNEKIFLTETKKNKLVKKLTNMFTILEAYYNDDIDILVVSANGTQITNKFKEKITTVNLGKDKITFEAGLYNNSVVEVMVTINDKEPSIISLYDFVDMVYKLRSVNYTNFTMSLMNYMQRPDFGEYEKDLREEKFTVSPSIEFSTEGNKNTVFSELKTIPKESKNSKRVNW